MLSRWSLLLLSALVSCRANPPPEAPDIVRTTTRPVPTQALGTAILSQPNDNIIKVHLRGGAVENRHQSRFVPTPDPWVVPHIGPLTWPAVFALDERRLWVWSEGGWGWLERGEVGFVEWKPDRGAK